VCSSIYTNFDNLRAHGFCAPLNCALDQWIYGILRAEWASQRV
jgi:hypothetical protein